MNSFFQTLPKACKGLLIVGLAGLAGLAQAAYISPLTGGYDGQGPLTAEPSGAYDTNVLDSDTLAALATAPDATTLFATSTTMRIEYLGTGISRDAYLAFTDPTAPMTGLSDPTQQLFETRDGCSYADWQGDPFCYLNEVGQWRDISGLTVGQSLAFALQALPQSAGDPSEQYSSTDNLFAGTGSSDAHMLTLDDGSLLIGFEAGGDADYSDMVFLLQPVADAGTTVPEPQSLALVLPALAAVVGLRRRVRR